MNEWERNRRMAEFYRKHYPPGTRLMLIHMEDPYAPVESGTRGTVNFIDDQSQIFMNWDNGRSLALVPNVDLFRRLTEEEIAEENSSMSESVEVNTFPQIKM